MNNPVSVELLENLEKLADRNGYRVMISTTDGNIETERKYVQLLDAGLVDTVLVPGPRRSLEEEYLQHIRKRNIALFNRDLAGLSLDVVKSDAVQAGRLAMEHLACRGYRRIGMILPPLETSLAQERLEGCQEGADAAGIRLEEKWMLRARGTTPSAEKLPQMSFVPAVPAGWPAGVGQHSDSGGGVCRRSGKRICRCRKIWALFPLTISSTESWWGRESPMWASPCRSAEALFSLLLLHMEGSRG